MNKAVSNLKIKLRALTTAPLRKNRPPVASNSKYELYQLLRRKK